MIQVGVFMKETSESPLTHFLCVRTQQKGTVGEPEGRLSPDRNSAGLSLLDFSASRTVRNKF
jgi:hypothetical protein